MKVTHIPLKYIFGVNSYLIETDTGYHLIDTGIKKTRRQLENALTEAGCKPGELKLIIITHGHVDHVGNAAYLRDKYNAKIAMHQDDINMVTGGGMFADVPPGLMIKIVGFFMRITGLGDFETFTPDILLQDNQVLADYGLDAKILNTPGHSKGSISILTSEGDLFCGDLIGNTKKPMKTDIIEDQDRLDASVEQLRALETRKVYPGHGAPFTMDEYTE